MSTTDLKFPGASIYPSSGPRRWLPTPDGHRLPPLRDLIAAHDSTTRKSNCLLSDMGLLQTGLTKCSFAEVASQTVLLEDGRLLIPGPWPIHLPKRWGFSQSPL